MQIAGFERADGVRRASTTHAGGNPSGMGTQPTPDLARLAVLLMVNGSRFARTMSRHTDVPHSLVAMRVLSNLQFDGPLRIGELAGREGISQPAMTATVNRLEGGGLVTRGADERDARASVVTLTAAGVATVESFRSRAAAAAAPALASLSADEVDTLARAAALLERLIPVLEAP